MRRSKAPASKKREENKKEKAKKKSGSKQDARKGKKLKGSDVRAADKGQPKRKIRWRDRNSYRGESSEEQESNEGENHINRQHSKDDKRRKRADEDGSRSPHGKKLDSEVEEDLGVNKTHSSPSCRQSASSEEQGANEREDVGVTKQRQKRNQKAKETRTKGPVKKEKQNSGNGEETTENRQETAVPRALKTEDPNIVPNSKAKGLATTSTYKTEVQAPSVAKSSHNVPVNVKSSKDFPPSSRNEGVNATKINEEKEAPSTSKNPKGTRSISTAGGGTQSEANLDSDIQSDSKPKNEAPSDKKTKKKSARTTKPDVVPSSKTRTETPSDTKTVEVAKSGTDTRKCTNKTEKKPPCKTKKEGDGHSNDKARVCGSPTSKKRDDPRSIMEEKGRESSPAKKTNRDLSRQQCINVEKTKNARLAKPDESGTTDGDVSDQGLPIENRKTITKRKHDEAKGGKKQKDSQSQKSKEEVLPVTKEANGNNMKVSENGSKGNRPTKQDKVTDSCVKVTARVDKTMKMASLKESSSTEKHSGVKTSLPLTQEVRDSTSNDSEGEDMGSPRKLESSEKKESSHTSSEEDVNSEEQSIKSKSSRGQPQTDVDSSDDSGSSENGDSEKDKPKEQRVKKKRSDEKDAEEQEEEKKNRKPVMTDQDGDTTTEQEEGENDSESDENDKSGEGDNMDKKENDDSETSTKSQESLSEENDSDEAPKEETSSSEDDSEARSDVGKDVKDKTGKGEFVAPFRKPLPSGVKAKLLNIKIGPGGREGNLPCGKGSIANPTHPSNQVSEPEKSTGAIPGVHGKQASPVPTLRQNDEDDGRQKDEKVVEPEIVRKRAHVFTSQTHVITHLRRKQREAREKLLNRENRDQIPNLTDVTNETEGIIDKEDQRSIHSSYSNHSSITRKHSIKRKNIKQYEEKTKHKDAQKTSGHHDAGKEKEDETNENVQMASKSPKNVKAACSISAFRKVTGWIRRVPPRKSNLRERLSSVARAIGLTDWLLRTFRKRKKHRQCELKRRTAMRLLSTSRLVNQFNQAPDGKMKADKEMKDEQGLGKDLEMDNQMDREPEEKHQEVQPPPPKLSDPSEGEEATGTGDARYAIVFPRIHHLAKTIKISPAVQKSANRTDQRAIASVQPASSSRSSAVGVKENVGDIPQDSQSGIPSLYFRSSNLKGSRPILRQTARRNEEPASVTFQNPRRDRKVHDEEDSVQARRSSLEDAVISEHQSSSTLGGSSPDDEEEVIQQSPSYEATTHVHWAQTVSGLCDPATFLSSEMLLPRLTIENLSKWSMYQQIPHAKPTQNLGRWEAEDLTEDILERNVHKKQVLAGEAYPDVEEVEDLSFLEDVCESAILLCLKKRFHRDALYTRIGHMVLSVNPFKSMNVCSSDMASLYLDRKMVERPPHIFAVVEEAFIVSQGTESVPNIVLSGHSGSGKTNAIKMISWYLMNRRKGSRALQLPDFLTILESFGNAKTSFNSNSTRFGMALHVFFKSGFVAGGFVSQYLLEKSRVVFQAAGERSFHVFYELLEGLPDHEKQSLYLQEPETYYYLNQGRACVLHGKNEKEDFLQLGKCLRAIGLSDHQLTSIWAILSAILQLGNICFTSPERDSFGSASAFSVTEIRIVAGLLQISPDGLQKAITQRVTVTSYDQVLSPLSVEASIDARDSISQALYSSLFTWLLEKGKDRLCAHETDSSLSVIDICGFENLGVNSLGQLCRNFASELIQYHSAQRLVTQEKVEYAREGLRWATLSPDGEASCLGILSERPHGILHILEEQTELAQATDHTFLQKCHYHHGDSSCYVKPKLPLPVFTLQHYAGPVTYQVHNFLNKNRDGLSPLARDVLSQSRLKLISDLFKTSDTCTLQRAHNKTEKCSESTLSARFQSCMRDLINRLERSRTLFVRCISPNTKKLPGIFDVEFVTQQLKNSGILELVQLMKEGYPVRIPLKEFARRYSHLAGRAISFSDERECCAVVLNKILGDHATLYQIGLSKVFLKERGREMLQSRWEELQSFAALTLQRNLRGFLNRKNFQAYRHKITVIQAHVRGHQARRRIKKIKHSRVQFGAALLIARIPSVHRRNHRFRQERPLGPTGQEIQANMDPSLLDIPAELAGLINAAQLQSNFQSPQITEVSPPQVLVQSNIYLPPDLHNFLFSVFIRSYFKDPSLPPVGKPLQDPLTRVSQNDRAAALGLYKLALRFVGNTHMSVAEQRIVGNYIAERCLLQSSLTDEVLCQVASMTVQNANDEQCQRAWLLMASLLSCLIPSPTLEKPLLKYVSDHGSDGYKAICQQKMLRAKCNVQNKNEISRLHAPCLLEWTANERRGKMVVSVYTDDDKSSAEVDSWTTGEQLAGWVLQSKGLDDIPRGWSISIMGNDQWLDLAGSDYLLDVIAEVEDGVPPPLMKSLDDYPFGDDSGIPEPPPDYAPGLPPGPPMFAAPGFPPPASPLSGPPRVPPPPPPPPPPFMPPSLPENNIPIPPAPPMQAPSMLPGFQNSGQNTPQRYDNFVDQAFNPILASQSDLDRSESLNWRMKGGGGIGPTHQGAYNQPGFAGAGGMPGYGMPMMNGMMPGMGAMPMMQPVQGMMPAQAMMPQVMPQAMPMAQPMMPAVDPTQLAAQQQAFINQQALLLAQQMTLQATMLSQQQQPPRRAQEPPQQARARSPPPASKAASKSTPAPAVKSASKDVSKPAPAPAPAPPPPPPNAHSAPAPPPVPLQSKPDIQPYVKTTEVMWAPQDEPDYAHQKRTFQQKRQFFQKIASQEIKVKSLQPPSKILLPNPNSDSSSSSSSDEEPPEPAEPEPQPDIPPPRAPPIKLAPIPKDLDDDDDVEPAPKVVVNKAPRPEPSREIREIIKMFQMRPEPEIKPFQPVRRQPQSFLKKKDPKQEALERLQMSGGPPPPPDHPRAIPPPVKSKRTDSVREKQKALLDVFPPNLFIPPSEPPTPREQGRMLVNDHMVRTTLMKHTASVYFSYSDVSLKLYVRKELFYPKERFSQPYYLNLLCDQIIRDTFSDTGFRLTREERRKMRDLLNQFRVGSDASSISDESLKKRIVMAARDNWENYFSRLFPVSLEEQGEFLNLGVSHRGIRLVKDVQATGIQQRHLKTLCSYSFADVLSIEISNSTNVKLCLRNEDLHFYSEKAQSLKALVDLFLHELIKDSNHVVALQSHITDEKSLLSFKKGDIIKLLPMDGMQPGWQFGSIGGRSGLFPSRLVQPAATPDYYSVMERKSESVREPKLLRRTLSKESSRTMSVKSVPPQSPSPTPSPTPSDVTNYTMVEFALKHFREPQTMMGWKGMTAEGKKPVDMVQHTKVPIQESLVNITDKEMSAQATNNFMTLMRFMGDQQYREMDDVACLYEILLLCKEKQMLKDEIYCQVLKQITENPKQESCNRGWIVLSLLTGYFAPSSALLPYVTKYLQDIQEPYQETSRSCQEHLRHTVRYHGRRHLPPRMELEALLSGRVSRRIAIALPSGAEYTTKIRTFTVAADLVPEICEQLLVSEKSEVEEFAIFANKSKGEVVRPLRAGDYIHDFLLPDNSVTLEFKRVTWKAPLRGRSELYVQVLFSQMRQMFMTGNCLLMSPPDKLDMQTGILAGILHRITKGQSTPPNKQELMAYLPANVHNRLNLQAVQRYLMEELRATEKLNSQQAKMRFLETVSALPLFDYSVFLVKRISDESLSSPCFVAVSHEHVLVLENNSQRPHLVIDLQNIKSMRTMRPFDENTLPGVELYYGSAENPHTLWMELKEAKELYHTIALIIEGLDTVPQ